MRFQWWTFLVFGTLASFWITSVSSLSRESSIDARLASAHLSKIIKEGKCKTPLPRVINIEELNPNARKKYLPHCTILHVCSQDTGCCRQENERCSPKKIEPVTLYFWVVELTPYGQRKGVEKVEFLNHTECHCVASTNNTRDFNFRGHNMVMKVDRPLVAESLIPRSGRSSGRSLNNGDFPHSFRNNPSYYVASHSFPIAYVAMIY